MIDAYSRRAHQLMSYSSSPYSRILVQNPETADVNIKNSRANLYFRRCVNPNPLIISNLLDMYSAIPRA